mgnify:CR=1 FL=1
MFSKSATFSCLSFNISSYLASIFFNLSVLFVERPQKYGYRGDYYFWEFLQQYFYKHPELSEKKDIEETIKQQFRKMSNMELTTEAMPCVQEFAHGGMSSGYLSGDFWLNTAIPLLQKRFDER